jgi:hypothetical protein
MLAPLALNQNGSAITVSTKLAAMMREADPEPLAAPLVTAQALAKVVERGEGRGRRC